MTTPLSGSLPSSIPLDSLIPASAPTIGTEAETKQIYIPRPASGRRMAVADIRDPANNGILKKTERVAQLAKPQ